MSLPNIPDINPEITLTREQVINLLLASIALEELGLAHIINAEGEKIQLALTPEFQASIPDLINIDESVNDLSKSIIKKEMFLQFKLENIIDYLRPTEYRIVLTWGELPRDLDSHLKGPISGGGQFHVFYANMTFSENGKLIAQLDHDDTTGFGPETTTLFVRPTVDGVYNFYVHNWSNEIPLSNSNGIVRVYKGSNLIQTFNVPVGDGRYWNVFTMDEQGNINPVNTITNIEP